MAWEPGDTPIRAVRCTKLVTNANEAYEAFQRMCQYDNLADSARAKAYRYSGGTATNRASWERCYAYQEVADGWRDALENWLAGEVKAARLPELAA